MVDGEPDGEEFLTVGQREAYGRFEGAPSVEDLERFFLLSYSGHTSVASLARYARVSPDALARWQQQRDPATRRR